MGAGYGDDRQHPVTRLYSPSIEIEDAAMRLCERYKERAARSYQQVHRNCQRSTGPLTPEGKHAASGNALKSGIYAEALIIPGERAQDLETLTAEYHDRFHPTTPEARNLVDSLIRHSWLLRRLAVIEAASFNCDCPGCADHLRRRSATPPARPAPEPHGRSRTLRCDPAPHERHRAQARSPRSAPTPAPSPRNPKSPNPLREIGFVSTKMIFSVISATPPRTP